MVTDTFLPGSGVLELGCEPVADFQGWAGGHQAGPGSAVAAAVPDPP